MATMFVIRCLRCLKLWWVQSFPQGCECGARAWQVAEARPRPYAISESDRAFLKVLHIAADLDVATGEDDGA